MAVGGAAVAHANVKAGLPAQGVLLFGGTAGKRRCPMPDLRMTGLAAAAAAGFLVAGVLPQHADAQSRGGSTAQGGAAAAAARSSLSTGGQTSGGTLTSPRPSSLPTSPSAIGTPAPQVPPVAPLTPQTTTTVLGTEGATVTTPGGTTTTTTTTGGLSTPTPGVGVPAAFPSGGGSARAPASTGSSAAGGGGDSFEACMGFWDAGTHMNKTEWAASCRRTMNRLENLKSGLNTPAAKPQRPVANTRT